jgi:hypothetical protein
MPQAEDELRQEFGISEEKAEQVIKEAGGEISKGTIRIPNVALLDEKVYRACEFLIWEWDYAIER